MQVWDGGQELVSEGEFLLMATSGNLTSGFCFFLCLSDAGKSFTYIYFGTSGYRLVK